MIDRNMREYLAKANSQVLVRLAILVVMRLFTFNFVRCFGLGIECLHARIRNESIDAS